MGKDGLAWVCLTFLISRAGDCEADLFQSGQDVTYLELAWFVACW